MSYADCMHIGAGAFSAAWLVTLFPSFTLSFLSRHSPVPHVTASSLALAASPTAVRALTCHWPCPLASAARSLVCLLGHLSVAPFSLSFSLYLSFFSPPFPPLLPLHRRVIHVCIHVRSCTVVSSPFTDTCLIFLGECFSCALYPRSKKRKLRMVKYQQYSGLLEKIFE